MTRRPPAEQKGKSEVTTILIVEDEESLSDPLAYLLRKEGFEAVVAADGQAGLDLFASEDIDLVLLDLMLPGMSGTEVCKKLRAVSSCPSSWSPPATARLTRSWV